MSDCHEVKRLLGLTYCECCDSCHEDRDEYGYYLCEVKIGDTFYGVCCFVQTAASKALKLNESYK